MTYVCYANFSIVSNPQPEIRFYHLELAMALESHDTHTWMHIHILAYQREIIYRADIRDTQQSQKHKTSWGLSSTGALTAGAGSKSLS